MRFSQMSLLLLVTSLCLAPPTARALTRTSVATPADSWTAGNTVDVSYYNTCTGWMWIWGWDPGVDLQLGVCYEAPANHSLLVETGLFQYEWIPDPSYGYAATIDVFSADTEGCPVGPALASQPYQGDIPGAPQQGWVQYSWNVMVPSRFVLAVTFSTDSRYQYGPEFFTDHPAAGPTGPAACGFCFPSNRVGRSFLWQDDNGAHCPGVPMNDFVCDAELRWYARFQSSVSVTNTGWGRIKTLYR